MDLVFSMPCDELGTEKDIFCDSKDLVFSMPCDELGKIEVALAAWFHVCHWDVEIFCILSGAGDDETELDQLSLPKRTNLFWVTTRLPPSILRRAVGSNNLKVFCFEREEGHIMQVLSDWIQKFWEEWELRAMVLLSLFLQIILIVLGNRRKYIAADWLQIIVWLCYMSADSLATVSLSVLSYSPPQPSKALWAPFLLLHLGFPDTITAYSLEDNELWLRHFLGLVLQVSVAFYVFLKTWVGGRFCILTLLMFVPGIIKYCEKTWVLRWASKDYFGDPFMEEKTSNNEVRVPIRVHPYNNTHKEEEEEEPSDAEILHKAYHFFVTFKRLFKDHILSIQNWEESKSFFLQSSWKSSFKMIEVELGFMFDVLYTKATLAYTLVGFFLRLVCFAFTINSLILFMTIEKHQYQDMDILTTYVLFTGAISLEIYASISLIFSDWAFLWLSKQKKMIPRISHAMEKRLPDRKRWPASIGQCSLITCCIKDTSPTITHVVQRLFCSDKWYLNSDALKQDEVRELIFKQLRAKAESVSCFEYETYPYPAKGDGLLRNNNFIWVLIQKTLVDVDFNKSILLWHIATYICYESRSDNSAATKSKRELSKLLSDYMMYLLLVCPYMLPEGIGMIRFRDTYEEVMEVLKKRKSKLDKTETWKTLLENKKDSGSNRSLSVLFEACELAEHLQRSNVEANLAVWEILVGVWMKMLCYAADNCRGTIHSQQLKRGGEFLTQIWLLMAHLGLTGRVRFSTEGQHRPK